MKNGRFYIIECINVGNPLNKALSFTHSAYNNSRKIETVPNWQIHLLSKRFRLQLRRNHKNKYSESNDL